MTLSTSSADGSPTADPVAPAEGLLPRLLTRWLFRQTQVTRNERLADGLHRISLQGAALCGLDWTPGDKLQLKLGPGMQMRTYTPIAWDPVRGETSFLAHALAWGPGSEWVRRAQPGQAVAVFGPRQSLDLGSLDPNRSLLVGDETAIGLALAWRPRQALFEADHSGSTQSLCDSLGLRSTVISRQAAELHLPELVERMLAHRGDAAQFVLAGRARTLQALQRALRAQGVSPSRIRAKAYWAEGKTGLD